MAGRVQQRQRTAALVRLSRREDGAVEVRSCAVKSRVVSNRNCVAARRGGEHRNENDQSGTQTVREGRRGELDSVGVDGRAFERLAKPVERATGGALRKNFSSCTNNCVRARIDRNPFGGPGYPEPRPQREAAAGDTGGARPHRARRVAARSGTHLRDGVCRAELRLPTRTRGLLRFQI